MAKKAKKKTPDKKTKQEKEKGPTLAERRAKIRGLGDKPTLIFRSDPEPPRIRTRFPRLNAILGGGLKRGGIHEMAGWEDSGKAQPLDALVLTPTGFERIGQLEVGDAVIGLDGRPTVVQAIYPQGVKDVYRVETSDGATTECCEEHLWLTQTRLEQDLGHPGKVRALAQVNENLTRGDRPNHCLPLVSPVLFRPPGELLIDPYLFGVLIGDGSFRPSSIVVTNSEEDVLQRILDLLPPGDEGVVYQGSASASVFNVRIKNGRDDRGPSEIAKALREMGLSECRSFEKFLPTQYLRASVEDRRRLLLGLMDTDGTVDKPGQPGVSYATSSARLCAQVVDLVRSLGGIAKRSSRIPSYRYKGELRSGRRAYKVTIQFPDGWRPVSSRKHIGRWVRPQLTHRRWITSIEPVGQKECRCIRVSADDGLYVTDGYIVTHNTSGGIALCADVQAASPKGKRHVVMNNYEVADAYDWWETLGLDVSDEAFTQLQPNNLEEGIADVHDLVTSGEVCAVLIDSVYAANAKDSDKIMEAWRDRSKGGAKGGGGLSIEARQWGKAWTAMKHVFKKHEVVVIAVNQVREKLGGPPRKGWRVPTTTPRGHALKFYAWVRMELTGLALRDADGNLRHDVDGIRCRMKVTKNKTSGTARGMAEYDLIRGVGFDLLEDLIDVSLECGAIKGGGGGHYQIGKHKVRGRGKLRALIESSEKIQATLTACAEKFLVPASKQA